VTNSTKMLRLSRSQNVNKRKKQWPLFPSSKLELIIFFRENGERQRPRDGLR
jgi:hypothetical protein